MATALGSNACQNETKETLIALGMIYNPCLLMTFSDGNKRKISAQKSTGIRIIKQFKLRFNCDAPDFQFHTFQRRFYFIAKKLTQM